ncbi:MAG: ferrous iron transport protein A [Anaerolineae bacterium]|nr:ferrous iron transport protein A [Anaerolineae bacterium]
MTHDATFNTARIVDLASLPTGTKGIIYAINGGRRFISRLTTMGFTTGTGIMMMQNYGHGPVIVLVRGTRMALGRGEARRILVSV